ncbi:MAG: YARHG domain-containing protein [Muribaculaceae bacterium]|jgi:hypothetical protein|nr:YARHG domain-containing protein [Muribaculaceae bacterium]
MNRNNILLKALLVFVAVITMALTANAEDVSPSLVLDKTWTDGTCSFNPAMEGNIIEFHGGTLHEGGYSFSLACAGDHFVLGAAKSTGDSSPQISISGKKGDVVRYQEIGGINWLIVYDKAGNAETALRVTDDFEKDCEMGIVNYLLAGTYRGSDNKTYTFFTGMKEAEGFAASKYAIEQIYEMPANVISFGTTHYWVERTQKGIDLYNATGSNNDMWNKGQLALHLTKIASMQDANGKRVPGLYPFTSTEILNGFAFNQFTSKELRLARNEVFARHGLIFSSSELKSYFSAQPWYNPTTSNIAAVTAKLSQIEKLNTQMMKAAEMKMAKLEASVARTNAPTPSATLAEGPEAEEEAVAPSAVTNGNYCWKGNIAQKTAKISLTAKDGIVKGELIKGKVTSRIVGAVKDGGMILCYLFGPTGKISEFFNGSIKKGKFEGYDHVGAKELNFTLNPVAATKTYALAPKAGKSVTGTYKYDYPGDEGSGTVKITKGSKPSTISFSASCVGHSPSYNMADAAGYGKLEGNAMTYRLKDTDCECDCNLKFTFCDGFLAIKTVSGSPGSYFGANMNIDGIYYKTK